MASMRSAVTAATALAGTAAAAATAYRNDKVRDTVKAARIAMEREHEKAVRRAEGPHQQDGLYYSLYGRGTDQGLNPEDLAKLRVHPNPADGDRPVQFRDGTGKPMPLAEGTHNFIHVKEPSVDGKDALKDALYVNTPTPGTRGLRRFIPWLDTTRAHRHSNFLGWETGVTMAGTTTIDPTGKPQTLSNNSGHFQPTAESLEESKRQLVAAGLLPEDIAVQDHTASAAMRGAVMKKAEDAIDFP